MLTFSIKYMNVEKVISFNKEKAIASFKQAKVLIGETMEMVKENKPCAEIMQKNIEAVSILRYGQQMLVQSNLGDCFKKSADVKDLEKNKMIRGEMLKVIKMFYK